MDAKADKRAIREWTEILELKREIADAGFKKQKFTYFPRPQDDRGFFIKDAEPIKKSIILHTKMRVYDKIDGVVKELPYSIPFRQEIGNDPNAMLELSEAVDTFLSEYAALIWSRRQLMKPVLKESQLEKDAKEAYLYEETLTLKEKGHTSRDIQKLIRQFKSSKLLERKLREYIHSNESDQYLGLDRINEGSNKSVELDRAIMSQIRSLYRGNEPPLFEEPVSDRRIHSNMAIVFVAVDFWTQHKRKKREERIWKYYERIKGGLYAFDNKSKEEQT